MSGAAGRSGAAILAILTLATAIFAVSGCAALRTVGTEALAGAAEKGLVLTSAWQLQDIAKVPQDGAAISRVGYSSSGWYKATVPGTVLTSLVNEGVYPEPLYGENNRPDKIPESLCRTDYWYRTQFTVPAAYAGKQIWLNFDGINYMADIWVNGQRVGEIRGAFARGIFDVTSLVKPGETAAVAVLIKRPLNPGNPQEQTVQLGTGGNGGVLTQDGPTFVCSVGWDWIPAIRDRNMGIWQKVFISATGPVVVKDPYVVTDLPLPRTDSADVSIQATVQNVTDATCTGILKGKLGDITFQSAPVSLKAKESQVVKFTAQTTPQLHIRNPRLWWPNGFGEPNLYPLHLSFDIDGTSSDARDLNVGIRKIAYEVPDSPNLTVSVNGVRVMCKGGNWGMDEAMKRSPRQRLEAQVRLHQLANYTMIRNWVGQSTSEDFYDLCDRYGIMVWDEFFQANRSDGPNPNDVPMYLANVREKVLRFRNHPSIAIWCGRNESDPAPQEVATGLQQIMAETDPARTYHANSGEGRGVRSGGPYSWVAPQRYYAAAAGAPGGGPGAARGARAGTAPAATGPTSARGARGGAGATVDSFKTEIGPVSIPTLEAVHAMLDPKDWEAIDNDAWAEHDLCRGAQEGRGAGSPLYSQMISQRFGKWANLADFVRKSQLANYEAHRALYEGRFARLFTPNAGVLLWMSNPAQPSFVWQIYSHDLETHASFFAARKACEPVHIQMNQSDFHVMVINNTPRELAGLKASIQVFNLDGTPKYQQNRDVIAKASAATDTGVIEFPQELSAVHFVRVELRDDRNRLVSDNFYWRGVQQDDLTALDSIATAQLDAKIARRDSGDKCLLDVTLTNPTKVVAVMAHFQLRKEKSNQRVLPVYYSDNYVSLLPGQSKTITIEAAARDLDGQRPLVMLDGWNVTTRNQSFSGSHDGAGMALNTDAVVRR